MIRKISISTKGRTEIVDITPEVADIVRSSKAAFGVCRIFVPHTTAGLAINENADPSVKRDILDKLNELVPFDAGYKHSKGNAAAHIKSVIVGTDKTLFIEGGKLALGTWQGIFFCEFDGPRQRSVYVKIESDNEKR